MKSLCDLKRPGFSSIELLVVIAIVGVLISIAVPAVQKAREMANLISCKNNLKQLGSALHNYESTYELFPNEDDWDILGSGETVFISLLPYVEQANLVGEAPQGVSVFLCPTRRGIDCGAKDDYASARHYTNWIASLLSSSKPHRSILGGTELEHYVPSISFPGVNLKTVANADGSSASLLMSHKCVMPKDLTNDEGWAFIGNKYEHKRYPQLSFVEERLDGYPSNWADRFGSPHPSSVPSLFADGSCRSIKYSLSGTILRKLWTYNDGSIVTEDS